MRLCLVRHTRPALNPGICYGQSDIAVNPDSFEQELAILTDKLKTLTADQIISSPLQRCSLLARRLSATSGYYSDPRLMELNFGAWEMQAWEAIPRSELDLWSQHYIDSAPPQGESFRQLAARVGAAVQQLVSDYPDQTVLMITHAGVIRAILRQTLNLPLNETFKFQLDYGGISQIQLDAAGHSVAYINR